MAAGQHKKTTDRYKDPPPLSQKKTYLYIYAKKPKTSTISSFYDNGRVTVFFYLYICAYLPVTPYR